MKKAIRVAILCACAALVVWAQSSVPTPARTPQSMSAPRVIKIAAKRFEFIPSQLTLKKGEPVTLQVTSEDVTHGFFLRPLKIDEELAPGQTRQFTVTPQTAGKFTIICDHFCGVNHGAMHMTIEVVE